MVDISSGELYLDYEEVGVEHSTFGLEFGWRYPGQWYESFITKRSAWDSGNAHHVSCIISSCISKNIIPIPSFAALSSREASLSAQQAASTDDAHVSSPPPPLPACFDIRVFLTSRSALSLA